MELHIHDLCPNRIVTCLTHDKPYQGLHGAQAPTSPVSSRQKEGNVPLIGCSKEMTASNRNAHEHDDCPERRVQCDLCETMVLAKQLSMHQQESCSKRIVRCPNLCNQDGITADYLEELKAHWCPEGKVACTLACGISSLIRKNQIKHETEECANIIIRWL